MLGTSAGGCWVPGVQLGWPAGHYQQLGCRDGWMDGWMDGWTGTLGVALLSTGQGGCPGLWLGDRWVPDPLSCDMGGSPGGTPQEQGCQCPVVGRRSELLIS